MPTVNVTFNNIPMDLDLPWYLAADAQRMLDNGMLNVNLVTGQVVHQDGTAMGSVAGGANKPVVPTTTTKDDINTGRAYDPATGWVDGPSVWAGTEQNANAEGGSNYVAPREDPVTVDPTASPVNSSDTNDSIVVGEDGIIGPASNGGGAPTLQTYGDAASELAGRYNLSPFLGNIGGEQTLSAAMSSYARDNDLRTAEDLLAHIQANPEQWGTHFQGSLDRQTTTSTVSGVDPFGIDTFTGNNSKALDALSAEVTGVGGELDGLYGQLANLPGVGDLGITGANEGLDALGTRIDNFSGLGDLGIDGAQTDLSLLERNIGQLGGIGDIGATGALGELGLLQSQMGQLGRIGDIGATGALNELGLLERQMGQLGQIGNIGASGALSELGLLQSQMGQLGQIGDIGVGAAQNDLFGLQRNMGQLGGIGDIGVGAAQNELSLLQRNMGQLGQIGDIGANSALGQLGLLQSQMGQLGTLGDIGANAGLRELGLLQQQMGQLGQIGDIGANGALSQLGLLQSQMGQLGSIGDIGANAALRELGLLQQQLGQLGSVGDLGLGGALSQVGLLQQQLGQLGINPQIAAGLGGLQAQSGLLQQQLAQLGIDPALAGQIGGLRGQTSGLQQQLGQLGVDQSLFSDLTRLGGQVGGVQDQLARMGIANLGGLEAGLGDINGVLDGGFTDLTSLFNNGFEDITTGFGQQFGELPGIFANELSGGLEQFFGDDFANYTASEVALNNQLEGLLTENNLFGTGFELDMDYFDEDPSSYTDAFGSGASGTLGSGFSGQEFFTDAPLLDLPEIVDYSPLLQEEFLQNTLNDLGAANPYDTRRDQILGGQYGSANRRFDEARENLIDRGATLGLLDGPQFSDDFQRLEGDRAETLANIDSQFGLQAAGADIGLRDSRMNRLAGALGAERADVDNQLRFQNSLQNQANADANALLGQYAAGYQDPLQYQDQGLSLAGGLLGSSINPTGFGASAAGGFQAAGNNATARSAAVNEGINNLSNGLMNIFTQQSAQQPAQQQTQDYRNVNTSFNPYQASPPNAQGQRKQQDFIGY